MNVKALKADWRAIDAINAERARKLGLVPACQRMTSINAGGWVRYGRVQKQLLDMGIKAKVWVLVSMGHVEVCCRNHDPDNFDDHRKFRIVDRGALEALDAERRLGLK